VNVLFRDVEVSDRSLDVRVEGATVTEIGESIAASGAEVVDG